MTTPTTPTTPTIRIRTETDLLAMVPYTFGFHPEDSMVLVLFDAEKRPFLARLDLPEDPEDAMTVWESLVTTVLSHKGFPRSGPPRGRLAPTGLRAVLIAYSDTHDAADMAGTLLAEVLEREGVEVLSRLRADGRRWFRLDRDGDSARAGVRYDLRAHELTSRAVFEGKVTYPDRDGLAGSLAAADPAAVAEVAAAHALLGPLPLDDEPALREEAAWARGLAGDASAAPLGARDTARLLRAVAQQDVRDVVWCDWDRAEAERHVRFWREVVRRSPEPLVAPAAALCGLAAWLAGDGALGWCAVDRCLGAEPGHSLGRLVSDMLDAALPPTAWRPVDPRLLRLAG